eukprot:3061544-Prorocentrum_lima.AAC.1
MGLEGFHTLHHGAREGDKALPFLRAKDFYEELFRAYDLPHEPKELLLETIHKYYAKAEGVNPDSISFKR